MSEMIVKLNSDKVKLNGCEYVQDLVRCGECEHRKTGRMGKMCIGRHSDDFCSYGKKTRSK